MMLVLLAATVCLAGRGVSFKCHKCNLEAKVHLGGGMRFEQMTCYCSECKEFVYITWKRGDPKPEPAEKKKDVSLYACPKCKKPTAVEWDEKHCPRCNSEDIEVKKTGMMYD